MLGLSRSNEIKVKITAEKECLQTFSVEMPTEKVKEKIEQAFVSVQSEAKIPGFRPGKTPLDLIKKTFQDTAYARAQDILLREGVSEAIKTKKINPIQSPLIKKVEFDPAKPFQFEFEVEVAPKFKLNSPKGMKLAKNEKVIGEEDVQKALISVAEMNSRLMESKDDILAPSHFAVIDYEGFLEGKSIEGAKAQNFLLDMSAPQAIAGLAEGLAGVKVGESKEISVNFPVDSPAKDLAGKQAVFKVKLSAIKEKKTPNIDDELAKDMGLGSLEEMKRKIRENLELDAKTIARRDLEAQIVERVLEDNKFVVPSSLVEQQKKHLVERQKAKWDRQGIPAENQIKTLATSQAEMKIQAEKDIRLAYIFDSFAEAEKISVSEDEITRRINDIVAKTDSHEKESVQKALQGDFRSRIHSEVKEAKIFDFITQQAKFK